MCVANDLKEELIALPSLQTTTKGTVICMAVKNALAKKEFDLSKNESITIGAAPNTMAKKIVLLTHFKHT